MSEPARQVKAHDEVAEPRRYTYNDILSELLRMHEDAEKYGHVRGSWRDRRLDILTRLIVLFETRPNQLVQAMQQVLRELNGGKAR